MRINLIGSPHIDLGQQSVPRFRSQRTVLLLGYLVSEHVVSQDAARPASREHLATLFWPDETVSVGKANLRRELHNLSKILPDQWATTRQTVQFAPSAETQLDLAQLQQGTPPATLGQFLEGVSAPDSAELENWLHLQRDYWQQKQTDAIAATVNRLQQSDKLQQAIPLLQKWVQFTPWQEEPHYHLMSLFAQTGQRDQALRQYGLCKSLLAQELDVAPSAQTTALFNEIQNAVPVANSEGSVRPKTPIHNLPNPLTPFIGRRQQVAEIAAALTDTNNRMLSIVAVGGMGKTRLSLAVANQLLQSGHFKDGVFFVELAPLGSIELLPTAIADAVGMHLQPQSAHSPTQQLLNFLSVKNLLLVMDNFEHLLAGAPLLVEILTQAPHVKILATSRERLNIQGETTYTLQGLELAQAKSDGVELFVSAAQRFNRTLALNADTQPIIQQICEMVDGIPLAIELAAGWTDTLAPIEIVSELNQSLDILETTTVHLPERHRSMRAVWAQTWARLSEQEKRIFSQLSVFRGGFSRQAAHFVTQISLRQLSAFINKGLLHFDVERKYYTLHELLRQFSAEMLAKNQPLAWDSAEKHADFYTNLIANWDDQLKDHRAIACENQIKRDGDNALSSFLWVCQHQPEKITIPLLDGVDIAFAARLGRLSPIQTKLIALYEQWHTSPNKDERAIAYRAQFLNLRFYVESNEQLERELKVLTDALQQDGLLNDPYYATYIGHIYYFKLGQKEQGTQLIQQAVTTLESDTSDPWLHTVALGMLADAIRNLTGDMEQARALLARSLTICQTLKNPLALGMTLERMAFIDWYQGRCTEAISLSKQAIHNYQTINLTRNVAGCYRSLGWGHFLNQELAEALAAFQKSSELFRELGMMREVGFTLFELSLVTRHTRDFDKAAKLANEGYALCMQYNDYWGAQWAQSVKADVLFERGELQAANEIFKNLYDFIVSIRQFGELTAAAAAYAITLALTGHVDEAIAKLQPGT